MVHTGSLFHLRALARACWRKPGIGADSNRKKVTGTLPLPRSPETPMNRVFFFFFDILYLLFDHTFQKKYILF